MMLTLTFLGVGSAFAKRNLQSNALIEVWANSPDRQDRPDDTLLLDFGATGPMALYQLKGKPGFTYLDDAGLINYPAIRHIVVTHTHADHIGGLEELAGMNRHVFGRKKGSVPFKPELIAAPSVLADLWIHSLSGGLRATGGGPLEMRDYFDVRSVEPCDRGKGDRFSLMDRFDFSLIPTDHIHVTHRLDWPSFAVLMTDTATGTTAFFSGDTRFDAAGLVPLMADSRVNFHDVELEEVPQPVHALLSELRTLPEPIRRKTYLYHYGDSWDDPLYDFVATEFAGFVKPHARYVLFPGANARPL